MLNSEEPIYSFIERMEEGVTPLDTGRSITPMEAVILLGIKKGVKTQENVGRRYLFWRFMRLHTSWGYTRIGALTGHDHTTVLHGFRKTYGGRAETGWLDVYKREVESVTNLIRDEKRNSV